VRLISPECNQTIKSAIHGSIQTQGRSMPRQEFLNHEIIQRHHFGSNPRIGIGEGTEGEDRRDSRLRGRCSGARVI